jgi:hypothetical protein
MGAIEKDEAIVRGLEAMLARWDGDGNQTYRELAIELLRYVRIEDAHDVREVRI